MKAHAKEALVQQSMQPNEPYIEAEVQRRVKLLIPVWTRRQMLAMCLALNDISHFGDKRLAFVMKGIEDIVTDYSSRAYTPKEVRKGSAGIDADAMSDMMQAELSSRRKIHTIITGQSKSPFGALTPDGQRKLIY